MKILIISLMGGQWAGSEELWQQSALRMRTSGHQVCACIQGLPGPLHPRFIELETAGVKVWRRPGPTFRPWEWLGGNLFAKIFNFNRLTIWERLARPGWDLVIISSGNNLFPWKCCGAFWRRHIPYVLLAHNAVEHSWPSDAARVDYQKSLRQARSVFFVSESNKQLTNRQLLFEHPKGYVVRNPCKPISPSPLPWPEENGGFRLAFVGRLEPGAKGCDLLLEVLAQPQWRDRPCACTFFGSGECQDGMRGLAQMIGVHHVRFAGYAATPADIWRDHHLLVLPSRYEGLPIVIVEAMMAGRPCLVTDVGGNAELLRDEETGFICPAPTVSLLASTLEQAWSQRQRWKDMGALGAQKVRQFVPEDPAEAFVNMLFSSNQT
jgi:glycosyltransferase involved in cell wall biosynthesis